MKRLLPVLAVFVAGFVGGLLAANSLGRPGGPEDRPRELMLNVPDPGDPTGTRTTEYRVYRTTSGDRGILGGDLLPPDGVKPTVVTLVGRDRIAHYAVPK